MIATTDLVERVASADTRLWTAWFEAVRDASGARHGVDIVRRGDAVFLRCAAIADTYYNRVMGLGGTDRRLIGEALRFFGRDRAFRVDMNPFCASESLAAGLIARRLFPASFQTSLYAELEAIELRAPRVQGVRVRRVRRSEIGYFARLYNRSYFAGERVPRDLARFRETSITARFGRAGWHHYVAHVDGIPAGGALLYVDGDVATLAGAATVYTMRRRGVQRALLPARLRDASAHGCSLVVSRCGVGSASQRNMERAGLRTAYTKVVWVRQPR